jgi:glycosyltransferase involved in cell wall biosynthesis
MRVAFSRVQWAAQTVKVAMVSDLIVVADRRPWAPGDTYQLMSRLLLDRRVLWLDANALRRERGDGPACAPALPERGPRPVDAPFPVLRAEDLGVGAHPLARLVSPRLMARRLERAAHKQGLRQPILWLASPWAAPLLDGFEHAPVVYQVSREPPPGDPGLAREWAQQEARILNRADLILAPCRELAQSLASERTHLLPPGVDLELFSTPTQPARDLPHHGPVAGCHGGFGADFDAALFAAIAARLPRWRFMLLGPMSCELSGLCDLPNVHIAGRRPHDQLPRYLQFWQASLLLRHPRAQIPKAPALTFLEALAAGLPVVVAGGANLGNFADLTLRGDDAETAAAALEAAAHEPRERQLLRRHRVAGQGWDARAAAASQLLAVFDAGTLGAVAGRR